MHDDQHRHVGNERDRDECRLGFKRHAFVKELVDALDARRGHEQRVTVGRSLGDQVCAKIAASPRLVFHNDRLTETLREFVTQGARKHVHKPAGRERRDHSDGSVGIGLGKRLQCQTNNQDETANQSAHVTLTSVVSSGAFGSSRWTAYSTLMLAARTPLPHFSVSSARSRPKTAGEPASGSPPSSAMRALALGSASTALISRLSFSTISAGVLRGAPKPNEPLAS